MLFRQSMNGLEGSFYRFLRTMFIKDARSVERVLICSGKIYYDLDAKRQELKDDRTAIVRLEQFTRSEGVDGEFISRFHKPA